MKLRLVMIAIIFPMIALASYFAWITIQAERATLETLTQSSERSTQQVPIKILVHELQKERGYSAGFVASGGGNFGNDLARQRTVTDQALVPAMNQTSMLRAERPVIFNQAASDLQQLASFRARISNQQITVPEIAQYYTAIIDNLLMVSYPVTEQSAATQMNDLQIARASWGGEGTGRA